MKPKHVDRRQPMYGLERVKQIFSGSGFITKQAMSDALGLGFEQEDIEQVIGELRPEHFYKSMPAKRVPGLWQDVYKITYLGVSLYIKLQLCESGESVRAVVIAFKQDASAS